VDTEEPAAVRELAKLEARIAELQAQARLLRDEIAGDATFRELLAQVDPHNDAKARHARHVGRNLRRIREERELSQRQLGMLLGYASGQRIGYQSCGQTAQALPREHSFSDDRQARIDTAHDQRVWQRLQRCAR
jgi:hypothetical protein